MWNTKIIDFIDTELQGNISLFKETPYHRGDTSLRKSNIIFHLTEMERVVMTEIRDPLQYAKYCKLNFYKYQEDFIRTAMTNRFIAVATARQMGFTMLSAFTALHYVNTNMNKTFFYVTTKNDSAAEFISKIKDMYSRLPFFMKPGIISWNAKSVEFDNGCRIFAKGGHDDISVGTDINFLYIDNAAHINNLDKHYRNITPSMVKTSDTKIIVSSSPNGYNWFYQLFMDAESGKNEFLPLRFTWNLVPSRDEYWKNEEIKNLGSVEMFETEYELKFQAKEGEHKKEVQKIESKSVTEMFERIMNTLKELDYRIKALEKKKK